MPNQKNKEPSPRQPKPAAAGRRRVVRTIAHGTILAAGIAAARLSTPEIDPRFEIFDPTLVDRLETPITRYHE